MDLRELLVFRAIRDQEVRVPQGLKDPEAIRGQPEQDLRDPQGHREPEEYRDPEDCRDHQAPEHRDLPELREVEGLKGVEEFRAVQELEPKGMQDHREQEVFRAMEGLREA
jgi:hypothetical protein